ncbi:MAG: anthranilate synthase component I family protein [Actinobacteria bacterium]|nr:anthranilate synthase component I family protein [Actinomycetota bacterium]
MKVRPGEPAAHAGGLVATGLSDVSDDPAVLDGSGRWAVAIPYSGPIVLARFDRWQPGSPEAVAGPWHGPRQWRTSLDRRGYIDAVERVRSRIAEGAVYQANVCRVMEADLPVPAAGDVGGLHALLCAGNPAPYGGMLRLPDHDVHIACASPELFLSRHGQRLTSGPIKGTGRTPADLTSKDEAENVMIVDLVRNDLSKVCAPGTVSVPDLLAVEEHPGLVHLVSRVSGHLVPHAGWRDIVAATFPPGSVTGAPKIAAVKLLGDLEPAPRGIYCGAFGWVDADAGSAELAVAIRTFWRVGDVVRFGTGAGITWGSDADAEWDETELKSARLIGVASGAWSVEGGSGMLHVGGAR